MLINNDFLGRGFAFPLEPKAGVGDVRPRLSWAHGRDDIAQSIRIILCTAPGERVLKPTFGCRLNELVFAEANAATRALAERYVRQALELWEPRIDVDSVMVTLGIAPSATLSAAFAGDRNTSMLVRVDYIVRDLNSPDNIVFPFVPLAAQ